MTTATAMRPLLLLLCAFAALLACAPVSAIAAGDIYRDCANGRLTGHYTQRQIREARKHIPTDIDEYTSCRDVLNRALTAFGARNGGGGGGSVNGSGQRPGAGGTAGGGTLTPATPAEARTLARARNTSGAPVAVAGARIVPGASGFAANAARHDLPWQLLLVLILLAVAALAAAVPLVRRHVLARRDRTL